MLSWRGTTAACDPTFAHSFDRWVRRVRPRFRSPSKHGEHPGWGPHREGRCGRYTFKETAPGTTATLLGGGHSRNGTVDQTVPGNEADKSSHTGATAVGKQSSIRNYKRSRPPQTAAADDSRERFRLKLLQQLALQCDLGGEKETGQHVSRQMFRKEPSWG